MKSGVLIYKCRMCGNLVKDTMVPDVDMAIMCILYDIPKPKEWKGVLPKMTSIHACDKDNTGVTDFVGGEKDKEEEIR